MLYTSISSISKVNNLNKSNDVNKSDTTTQFTQNKISEGLVSNLLLNVATALGKAGL
ncbi:hypothetical protein DDB_G0279125 [Dictyostelium discoideum AX4]|uniref:Uncharacterized protein n=1 Tax=Dictyostelium discoideum TaxID=44689 RepID=Q54X92_DICDI|nr:hypothetical protein DDB_G0279125 [Dictyostelium discoideum AX4]EAL67901.1 hypothetical protein DDB_G0279125 [Dictyostelium discoideum AX4]|eukprot:XP_641875.1 hypothetical protein DDB_G0279125 [Dictyostelium discoideum AX4]